MRDGTQQNGCNEPIRKWNRMREFKEEKRRKSRARCKGLFDAQKTCVALFVLVCVFFAMIPSNTGYTIWPESHKRLSFAKRTHTREQSACTGLSRKHEKRVGGCLPTKHARKTRENDEGERTSNSQHSIRYTWRILNEV